MITLRGVSRRYGAVAALEEVSLDLGEGEVLCVLGPSGSGKTTLLRIVAGLEPPDTGEVAIDGRVASAPGRVIPSHLRGMGLVPQTAALWPHMTVAQNILFGLQNLSRGEARGRLGMLLAATGLGALAGRYPHQISGGEARRVALARALAPRPRCLLMDEPLTNLDPDLKTSLLDLIAGLRAEMGASLLYVTHHADEAEVLGGRVLTLRAGRVEGAEADCGG